MHEERFEELSGDVAVERSVTLPADQDTVWEHLTDGRLLGDWMGSPIEIDPRPGGRIVMTPEDGSIVWGTVEESIPGRRLQWSWRTDDGLRTQVEIEMEPGDDGTDLTARETLLPWTSTGQPPQWVDRPGPELFLSVAA